MFLFRFWHGFRNGLLFHRGLFCKHGFLCIPHLFHQLFHFLYVGFVHVACCVHALGDLVQITANFSECSVVIPQIGIVNVIDKTHTKSDAAGKRIYFSCRRFLLSASVCIVHRHLEIFLTHFCVHVLPFLIRSPYQIFKKILQKLMSSYMGYLSKKIQNFS